MAKNDPHPHIRSGKHLANPYGQMKDSMPDDKLNPIQQSLMHPLPPSNPAVFGTEVLKYKPNPNYNKNAGKKTQGPR